MPPAVLGGPFTYQIQIDNNSTFTSPAQDVRASAAGYTAGVLSDGKYYWRVRAINSVNTAGTWSTARAFTIDTTPPLMPILLTPTDRSALVAALSAKPKFTWQTEAGTAQYRLSISSGVNCDTFIREIGPLATKAYTLTAGEALPDRTTPTAGRSSPRTSPEIGDPIPAFSGWSSVRPPLHCPAHQPCRSPANTLPTNNATPVFNWTLAGATGMKYQIQIDNQSTFTSPEQDVIGPVDQQNYTAAPLAQGKSYWRVRAINNSTGVAGLWTAAWSLTVDSVPPAAPALKSPANNGSTTLVKPTLAWVAATGATSYRVQVATDSGFGTKIADTTVKTLSYTLTTPLAYGTMYYWHVQAIDALSNTSDWSATYTFVVSVHRTPVERRRDDEPAPDVCLAKRDGCRLYAASR